MSLKKTFDEYIQDCEGFAQPILAYLRDNVHEICPNIEEQIKWNFPCFMYKGKILVHMAGFKQHVAFGFQLANKMSDPHKVFISGEKTGMGNFGKLTSIDDLPSKKILAEYLHEAMQLHAQGAKRFVRTSTPAKKLTVHPDLKKSLSDHGALKQFEVLSSSQQNEYAEWITDAKTDATRSKRIDQAVEWISEGKPRNWKYMAKWKA